MKRLNKIVASLVLTGLVVVGSVAPSSAQTWMNGYRLFEKNSGETYYDRPSLKEGPAFWITAVKARYNKTKNMNLNGKAREITSFQPDHLYLKRFAMPETNVAFQIEKSYNVHIDFSEKIGKGFKYHYMITNGSIPDDYVYMEVYDKNAIQFKWKGWKTLLEEAKKDYEISSGAKFDYTFIKNGAFTATEWKLGGSDYVLSVMEDINGNCYVMYGPNYMIWALTESVEVFDGNVPNKFSIGKNCSYAHELIISDGKTERRIWK